MKRFILTLVLVSSVLFSGCAAVGMAPVTGFIYTDVKAPVTATNNSKGNKKGEAVCTSILGIVAIGDCSIDAAAKNGNITKINTVDYNTKNILGIYATVTVIVTGD